MCILCHLLGGLENLNCTVKRFDMDPSLIKHDKTPKTNRNWWPNFVPILKSSFTEANALQVRCEISEVHVNQMFVNHYFDLFRFDVHTLWLLQSRVPFTIYTINDVYILLLTFTHVFAFVFICDHILFDYIHYVYIYMFCIYLGFVGVPFHSWVTKWCHTINFQENSLQGAPLKLLFMQVWWGWTWTINKLVPISFDHFVMALMLWTAGY